MENTKIVNGQSVVYLAFGSFNGKLLGSYEQRTSNKWVEVNSQNEVSFHFDETHRDEWSVYLHDPSRKVSLQLDLHRKIIVYSDASSNTFDLYSILTVKDINAFLVREVSFENSEGRPLGLYRQTGEKIWIEFDRYQNAIFRFKEVARDIWSVYLFDESRKVNIQLDLHRKSVVYSDKKTTNSDLYKINGIHIFAKKPILIPPITGHSVNYLELERIGDKTKAYLKKTGAFTWVELDKTKKTSFYFNEIKRHKGVLYLQDVSRYVTLAIHLNSKQIVYSDDHANRFPYYTIIKAQSKINGWVANFVSFRSNEGVSLGTYRQVGTKTWVELNNEFKVVFRFNETHRDDWSVYLYDPSRKVNIQLDLHTQKVVYSTATTNRTNLYEIERAYSDPSNVIGTSNIPVKSRNVRTVAFGKLNGEPLGTYRQIGQSTWAEVSSESNQVTFTFDEVKRDHHSIYLHDASRGVSLNINLETKRIVYSDTNRSFDLYTVLRTSAVMNGWLVSELSVGNFSGEETEIYRQTGAKTWASFDKKGTVRFHFKEVRREDWSVFLEDSSRKVDLQLDLRSKRVFYWDVKSKEVVINNILSEAIESGIWLHSEKITSRSALTEDFDIVGSQLNPKPVYRTSIKVSKVTSYVDIWASEEVTVEVDGKSHTIDPVKPVRVGTHNIAMISISMPANDVQCPSLRLRTNLMMPTHTHYIFPDVEAHKKIVGLKEGDLHKSRAVLDIPNKYTKEDLDHFQKSLQNIAKTVQHTYNKTPHGVHHDRVLHPKNMQHPHFLVNFANNQLRYAPLHPSEVQQHLAGARMIYPEAAQNIFGDIGHFFQKAAKVVIHTIEHVATDVEHTVESVAKDIVQTVENVGSDIVHTVENVGEDIIHGDIIHAGQDLLQGGENLGKDLSKGGGSIIKDVASGAKNVAGDVVSGAGQLLVLTIHTAEEVVQFVLTHTGVVGKAISWLFDKIGTAIHKVVDWLLDKLGWTDILHTHDAIMDLFNAEMDKMAAFPIELKKKSDKFFTHLTDTIVDDIDTVLDQFDVLKKDKKPSPVASHSGAVEKVEWFIGKLFHNSHNATALSFTGFTPTHHTMLDDFVDLVEKQLGQDGGKIIGAIENSFGDLESIFSDSEHTLEYLLGAVLEIVKAVVILSLDAVKVICDFILDLAEALIKGVKDAVNLPWHIPFIEDLYKAITDGREMSFLSCVSLLAAIPVTLISKAEFNKMPFESQKASASLEDLEPIEHTFGIVYGVSHIILGAIGLVADTKSILDSLDAGTDSMYLPEKYAADQNAPDSTNRWDFLSAADFTFGLLAQFMAMPIPKAAHSFTNHDWAGQKNDLFNSPNYWGHVIWYYQWAGMVVFGLPLAAELIAKGAGASVKNIKKLNNAVKVFDCAWGLAHMGLMGTLDVYDRKKKDALSALVIPYKYENDTDAQIVAKFEALQASAENTTNSTDVITLEIVQAGAINPETGLTPGRKEINNWFANAKNYKNWAAITASGGIPNKGFANVMDTFPEIGQLGFMPALAEETLGISAIIGMVLFDILGHEGEGITAIVRTGNNGLL